MSVFLAVFRNYIYPLVMKLYQDIIKWMVGCECSLLLFFVENQKMMSFSWRLALFIK